MLQVPFVDTLHGTLHTACFLLLSILSPQVDFSYLKVGNISTYLRVQLPPSTPVPEGVHHIESSIMKPESSKMGMHFYSSCSSLNRCLFVCNQSWTQGFRCCLYLLDGLFLHSRLDDHLMPTVPINFSKKKRSFPIVLKENLQGE